MPTVLWAATYGLPPERGFVVQTGHTGTLPHVSVAHQIHDLCEDLSEECKRELQHDTTQRDSMLRRHITGRLIVLLAAVILVLIAAMIGIAIYPAH